MLFLCPRCGARFELPVCGKCGFEVPQSGGVWNFTDDPEIVENSDGDSYIGYERIGKSYSCRASQRLDFGRFQVQKAIAGLAGDGFAGDGFAGDGVFLDVGCGDGEYAVPVASFGTAVVACDISGAMLRLLRELAAFNHISLAHTVTARMNALHLPVADDSVSAALANSMLHLVSNPGKVVAEIRRVLKPGGVFICLEDAPGIGAGDNGEYEKIQNEIYHIYWSRLAEKGIAPRKYAWRFDRAAECEKYFSRMEKRTVDVPAEYYEETLADYFLPRMRARGFSDQTDVPEGLHASIFARIMVETRRKYGDDFDRRVSCRGVRGGKTELLLYYK